MFISCLQVYMFLLMWKDYFEGVFTSERLSWDC